MASIEFQVAVQPTHVHKKTDQTESFYRELIYSDEILPST